MRLCEAVICSFLLTSLAFAAFMPTEKIRSKRTLQYFFEGLLSVFNNRPSTKALSRVSSNQRMSSVLPVATLSRLSSISTPPKVFDAFDDEEVGVKSKKNSVPNSASSFVQIAIPSEVQTTKPSKLIDNKTKNETNMTVINEQSSYEKNNSISELIALNFPDESTTENLKEETTTIANTENCSCNSSMQQINATDQYTTKKLKIPLIFEHPAYVNDKTEKQPGLFSFLLKLHSFPQHEDNNSRFHPIIHLHQPHIQFHRN